MNHDEQIAQYSLMNKTMVKLRTGKTYRENTISLKDFYQYLQISINPKY